MPYPTTVQLIQRRRSQQWYVNFPAAVANALDFAKGETVEWTVLDRRRLLLARRRVPQRPGHHTPQKTNHRQSHMNKKNACHPEPSRRCPKRSGPSGFLAALGELISPKAIQSWRAVATARAGAKPACP